MSPQAGFFFLLSGMFLALWIGQAQKDNTELTTLVVKHVQEPSSETTKTDAKTATKVEVVEAPVAEKAEYDEQKIVVQKEIFSITTDYFLKAHPELPKSAAQEWVEMDDLKDGAFLIRLAAADLYPSNTTKIHPRYVRLLREYAEILKPLGRKMKITGFVDAFEKGDRWSLSAQRAAKVAEDWEKNIEIPHELFTVEGLGRTAILSNRKNTNPKRLEITVYKH